MDMLNPGNTFEDYFLLGITFLPLLPALLIFVRKGYGQEPLNYLVVICLLCFLQGIIGFAYPLTQENQFIVNKIFTLLLFLFFVLAFRTNLNGRLRYGLSLFLTALLSVIFTYWSLKGWDGASPAIEMVLNGFLVVLIGISLHALLHNDELGIFRSPLFWMEGGTLFYILISLMLEGLGTSGHPEAAPSDAEKRLFLGLADLVRYVAYIAAVFAL